MARIHGRKGRLYVGLASEAATAQPVTFLNKWSFKAETAKSDVSSFDDDNIVYVSGFADAQGDFAGFYDTETEQTYTAASDGIARKFYLYPERTQTTRYIWGTAIFDFNAEGSTDGSVTISGSWAAASKVTKQPNV